jgi:hypothetical protein
MGSQLQFSSLSANVKAMPLIVCSGVLTEGVQIGG